MSHLLFRISNHVIRTLARPGISWLTYYKKMYLKDKKNSNFIINQLVRLFVYLGQRTFQLNNKINKKIFNLKSIDESKLLSEEKALEKGIETFSEIIIYSILLSIPIIEYNRSSKETSKQQKERKEKLTCLHEEVIRLCNKNESIKDELGFINKELDYKLSMLKNI